MRHSWRTPRRCDNATPKVQALQQLRVEYFGRNAHAAAMPWRMKASRAPIGCRRSIGPHRHVSAAPPLTQPTGHPSGATTGWAPAPTWVTSVTYCRRSTHVRDPLRPDEREPHGAVHGSRRDRRIPRTNDPRCQSDGPGGVRPHLAARNAQAGEGRLRRSGAEPGRPAARSLSPTRDSPMP